MLIGFYVVCPWWGKNGHFGKVIAGKFNQKIWREILTFEIKKYITNSRKSDYLAGKIKFFQAVGVSSMNSSKTVRWRAARGRVHYTQTLHHRTNYLRAWKDYILVEKDYLWPEKII